MAINDPLYAARVKAILQTRGFQNVSALAVAVRDVAGVVTIARWDPQYGAQPTDAQIAAVTDAQAIAAGRAERFQATADDKDNLATIALIVRARGVAAWNGMTQPQKIAAVRAEADVWRTIRDFIEDNL